MKGSFVKAHDSTSSDKKKWGLKKMYEYLKTKQDDEQAYAAFTSAIKDKSSDFSKAIDEKTGFGMFSKSASNSRIVMEALERKLALYIEGNQKVSVTLTTDKSGHGFGQLINENRGDELYYAYDAPSAIKKTEEPKFISKGTLFKVFNKSGLDYKGQVNYAGLT